MLVTHSSGLSAAVAAAKSAGIPLSRVALIDSRFEGASPAHATVEELIKAGRAKATVYVERRLRPGEAKTKLALLCFSSGTTGKPKAVAIAHYSMIANILQMRMAIGFAPRYVPGDVALAGLSAWYLICHSYADFLSSVAVLP